MLHKIFFDENGIVNEIIKDIICREKAQCNPFLQPIEAEIKRLENIEEQIKARREAMKQLHHFISGIFNPPEPEKNDPPEKTQTQEAVKKKDSIKREETTEKIDGGPEESLSEPMLRRLKTLEKVIRDYAEKLAKEKITGHFKQIGELHRKLEKSLDWPDDKKESMEYLVGLEATAGDALDFLGTSKLAGRFNLLKFLRVELSEALINKKGAEMHI